MSFYIPIPVLGILFPLAKTEKVILSLHQLSCLFQEQIFFFQYFEDIAINVVCQSSSIICVCMLVLLCVLVLISCSLMLYTAFVTSPHVLMPEEEKIIMDDGDPSNLQEKWVRCVNWHVELVTFSMVKLQLYKITCTWILPFNK